MKKIIDAGTRAFTLIEMLVVVAIIAILAAILLPTIGRAKRAGMEARARTEARSLANAVKAYLTQYGKFPDMENHGTDGDVQFGNSPANHLLINVLRAHDGTGNAGHTHNPRKIVFLEVGKNSLLPSDFNSATAQFVDPWNQPFEIICDYNFNNICEGSPEGDIDSHNVVAWSWGVEGTSSTNLLKSWD